jgi:hypothetical protein
MHICLLDDHNFINNHTPWALKLHVVSNDAQGNLPKYALKIRL